MLDLPEPDVVSVVKGTEAGTVVIASLIRYDSAWRLGGKRDSCESIGPKEAV